MNKLYIGTMSMNYGDDIPDSILHHNLKNNFKNFNVIVADGNLTEYAKERYKRFNNVRVLDSPWQDSHIKQYQAIYSCLNEGDWLLYLDDDEQMSPVLLDKLKNKFDPSGGVNFGDDMFALPCVLHLEDKPAYYYPAETIPPLDEDLLNKRWTKQILVKKCNNVFLEAEGSHVQFKLKNWKKLSYLPYPYFHFRTLKSFVEHDCWQMYLSPRGQHLNDIESAQFKLLTKQYKTMKEFRQATKDGTWPVGLQKFAYDFRNELNRPISRLYIQYHIFNGHPCFRDDSALTWDVIKQHVQSPKVMQLFEQNKQNKTGEIIIERDV